MKLKSLIAAILFLLTLILPEIHVYAAVPDPVVYINNNRLPQAVSMSEYGGISYIPAGDLASELSGTFTFRADSTSGTVSAGGHEVVYYLDRSTVRFDGKYIQAAAPMKIIKNRFMIPAVFTLDKLGASSYFDSGRNALMAFSTGGRLVYSVLPGDSLWRISQIFSVTVDQIRKNNFLTSDMLMIGQKLFIRQLSSYSVSIPAYTLSGATVFSGPGFNQPVLGYLASGAAITITGKTGDWYRVEAKPGTGYVHRTVTGISQDLALPSASTYFSGEIPVDTSRDTVTYQDYTVVRGDSVWSISQKTGIPDYELAGANRITTETMLYPGQVLKVPVHNIALPLTSTAQYGEVLDWFKQAQYLFPQGKTGRVVDADTGKSFMVRRTMGSSHSDTETLTAADTAVMKQLFGGAWTWTRKAFILEVDGRRFAISIAGMPHAGVDGVPLNQNVDGRSGNYGYGPNYDAISGNDMNGHFDLYFLNCRRHMDNQYDPEHQLTVLTAGGLR